jgi:hypothetical protein
MKTILLTALLLTVLPASAQETADNAVVSKGMSAKFATLPNLPDCASLAALKGDPGKGPSVIEMKFTPGCIVPTNGDYGYLPSKHIHQAKCTGSKPCAAIFFLDAPIDIHYVDKSGAEIPAAQALAEAEKLMTKPGAKPPAKP